MNEFDEATVAGAVRDRLARAQPPEPMTVDLDRVVAEGNAALHRGRVRRRSALGAAASVLLGAAAVPVVRRMASRRPAPGGSPGRPATAPGELHDLVAIEGTFADGTRRTVSLSAVGSPPSAYQVGVVGGAQVPAPVAVAIPPAGQLVTGRLGGGLFVILAAPISGNLAFVFPPDRQPGRPVDIEVRQFARSTLMWPDLRHAQGDSPIGIVYLDDTGAFQQRTFLDLPTGLSVLAFDTQPSAIDRHIDRLLLVRSGDRLQLNGAGSMLPPQPVAADLVAFGAGPSAPRVVYGWAPARVTATAANRRRLVVTQRPARTGGVLYAVTAAPAKRTSVDSLQVRVSSGGRTVTAHLSQP